ncbi:MAG: TetR/AcrR family transcriptional regulator [Chloroflexi bacterium]|nr:TetR/AcrR family transcriptional regulator [Chloroflexota bacterium]
MPLAVPTASRTRERVLRAAAELFAARGFAGTSISAIRSASGALASSIYWEFGSKDGILVAVLQDAAARWLDQARACAVRATAQPGSSAAHRLRDYLDYLAGALAERPEFLRLLLLLSLERRDVDPASLRAIRQVRQHAIDMLAHLYVETGIVDATAAGSVATDLARASLAFFDGSFIAAQIDPETTDLRRMFSMLQAGITAAVPEPGDRDAVHRSIVEGRT